MLSIPYLIILKFVVYTDDAAETPRTSFDANRLSELFKCAMHARYCHTVPHRGTTARVPDFFCNLTSHCNNANPFIRPSRFERLWGIEIINSRRQFGERAIRNPQKFQRSLDFKKENPILVSLNFWYPGQAQCGAS